MVVSQIGKVCGTIIFLLLHRKKQKFMKRVILSILIAITTLSTAMAQQKGKVSFVLLDSESKQAVIGAVIELYPTAKPDNKRYYTSNVDGSVKLPSLEYGEYTILATI